jgi:hypothetical protein
VSLRGSYGSLKAGFQNSSCTLLAKRGRDVYQREIRELEDGFAETE